MIKIFNADDKEFLSNGNVIIKPTRAIVTKEDNGEFYLDLECLLKDAEYIEAGNIIVAPTPQGEQAFRISNPSKTSHKITTKCQHVFFDSANYLIADSNVVNKDCKEALAHLNNATEPKSTFTTTSDITTVDSYRCVRSSLYEAIQTVIEQWGGHLVRDNFNIAIKESIGQDNGVTVQYAKNLKEITCEQNWDSVVTKLLPVGKDGILLNALDEKASLYVESKKQYSIPYTKTVSFSQNNVNEDDYKDSYGDTDEEAYKKALVKDLKKEAEEYVESNSVPQVNYTLNANLEKITDIGDTVEVKDKRLGIDILTHVIKYEYDCILGRYTSLEFGNFTQSLSGLVSNITESVSSAVSGNVQATLEKKLNEALKGSNVINDGDKILILDKLPKEEAVNVIRLNSDGLSLSTTGINGVFTTVLSIDGTLNMQAVDVINLTSKMISGGFSFDSVTGGTLMLGAKSNNKGTLKLYNSSGSIIAQMGNDGVKIGNVNLNNIFLANNVITGTLTGGNIDTINQYATKTIPLNSWTIAGTALSSLDNGVKIGTGVKKVLVSGAIRFSIKTSGDRYLYIYQKSASTNFVIKIVDNVTTNGLLYLPPKLIEVNEGDILTLCFVTTQTGDKILYDGNSTYLTVEVVE